jgi:DNA primase
MPYRSLGDKDSVIPAKSTLYGFDEASPGGNVVIVEGPIDQWKLGPGAVSTLGTAWTMNQVSLLRELNPNKVFILFDSEEEAQKSAKSLCDQIWFCECEIMYLDGVKDPGELSVEEGIQIMKQINE